MTRDVEVVSLIHTRLLRRGEGTEESPVRIVEQWWTMDGDLVFEWDSYTLQGTKYPTPRSPLDWLITGPPECQECRGTGVKGGRSCPVCVPEGAAP